MRLEFTRDYRNRNTGLYGFSTGVFQNIGERVSFRYVDFQVWGIGRLSINWTVKGWAR